MVVEKTYHLEDDHFCELASVSENTDGTWEVNVSNSDMSVEEVRSLSKLLLEFADEVDPPVKKCILSREKL